MTSAGHPTSLIPSNDKFFLFIGLGPDRATAQSVGEYYKEAGVETYVKTYQVTGTTVPPTAETKAWFEEAIPLYAATEAKESSLVSFDLLSQELERIIHFYRYNVRAGKGQYELFNLIKSWNSYCSGKIGRAHV